MTKKKKENLVEDQTPEVNAATTYVDLNEDPENTYDPKDNIVSQEPEEEETSTASATTDGQNPPAVEGNAEGNDGNDGGNPPVEGQSGGDQDDNDGNDEGNGGNADDNDGNPKPVVTPDGTVDTDAMRENRLNEQQKVYETGKQSIDTMVTQAKQNLETQQNQEMRGIDALINDWDKQHQEAVEKYQKELGYNAKAQAYLNIGTALGELFNFIGVAHGATDVRTPSFNAEWKEKIAKAEAEHKAKLKDIEGKKDALKKDRLAIAARYGEKTYNLYLKQLEMQKALEDANAQAIAKINSEVDNFKIARATKEADRKAAVEDQKEILKFRKEESEKEAWEKKYPGLNKVQVKALENSGVYNPNLPYTVDPTGEFLWKFDVDEQGNVTSKKIPLTSDEGRQVLPRLRNAGDSRLTPETIKNADAKIQQEEIYNESLKEYDISLEEAIKIGILRENPATGKWELNQKKLDDSLNGKNNKYVDADGKKRTLAKKVTAVVNGQGQTDSGATTTTTTQSNGKSNEDVFKGIMG